jgi:hypothetical protein
VHDVPQDVLSLVVGDPSAPGSSTIMEGGIPSARMPVGLHWGMVGSSPKGKAAASWGIVSIDELLNITAGTLVYIQELNTGGEFVYVSDCCQC